MLVNVDAKHLDWTAAVFLAQDEVGIQEIQSGFDLHTDNKEKFGLPSRLIAKVFLFRIIFGGSAYSFANDIEFADCKLNEKQWNEVIDKFYSKYKGVAKWHRDIVKQVVETGVLTIPTGRSFTFEPKRNWKGEMEWPITTIKNYPVQGLEADLMMITRISLYNRLKQYPKVKFVNSVHDSILVDCPDNDVGTVVRVIYEVFRDVPLNFERIFKVKFNIPYRGEVQVGKDYKKMEEVVDTYTNQ